MSSFFVSLPITPSLGVAIGATTLVPIGWTPYFQVNVSSERLRSANFGLKFSSSALASAIVRQPARNLPPASAAAPEYGVSPDLSAPHAHAAHETVVM